MAHELLSFLVLSHLEYESLSTVGEGNEGFIYQIWSLVEGHSSYLEDISPLVFLAATTVGREGFKSKTIRQELQEEVA